MRIQWTCISVAGAERTVGVVGCLVQILQPGVGRCGAIFGVWIGMRGRLTGRGSFSPGFVVTSWFVRVGIGMDEVGRLL